VIGRMRTALVSVVLFIAISCVHAQQTPTCFVSTTGNDTDTCGTMANPCQTLSQCISIHTVGTPLDITLFPGTYPASGNCDSVINTVDPLTISALNATLSNPTPAIFDCTNGHLTLQPVSETLMNSSYVHFSSIKFRSGLGQNGGCVYFDQASNVTAMDIWFTECTFENCQAAQEGGALSIATSASVQISFCNFTNNNADMGGAIANAAWLTPMVIMKTLFVANSARQGGAIWSTDVSKIIDSQFVLNRADEQGGCVYHNLEAGVSEFTRCVATGNNAQTGGAFYLTTSTSVAGGSFNFRNSTITNNEAVFGGAIALDPTSIQPIQMTGSDMVIMNNKAIYGGFLWASTNLLNIPNNLWIGNQIQLNSANQTGGGIYITTEISNNKANEIFLPGLILSMNTPDNIYCQSVNSSEVQFCKPCGATTCADCSAFVCVEGLTTAAAPAMCYSNLPKTCANDCYFETDMVITCAQDQNSSSEGEKPFTHTAGFVILMVLIVMSVFVIAAFGVIHYIRKRRNIQYTELK